jgi:hypothetical protein
VLDAASPKSHEEHNVTPTVGRIVHYKLTEHDAAAINKRRSDFQAFRSDFSGPSDPGDAGADGHVAHIGNHVRAGEVYAATIVRIWGETPQSAVNLQVHMDGNDTFWATSRNFGLEDGEWSWPPRG